MNIRSEIVIFVAAVPLALTLSSCQLNGEPVFKDTEHSFNVGGPVNDDAPLSDRVREALRNSPETAILRIQVSQLSEDSVKLSGYVDNDATMHEAERIAGGVDGVRFVVNAINIRRK